MTGSVRGKEPDGGLEEAIGTLVDAEHSLLGVPPLRQFDAAGKCNDAQLGRLATFDHRFNDPRRQKSQLDQPPQGTAINLFSPSEVAQRWGPTRNKVQRPSARA